MARYTCAYSALLVRLPEVNKLQELASEHEDIDPILNRNTVNALCRGSIVLLSSHLEGYIKELGELTLERIVQRSVNRELLADQLFYHLSKDLLYDIKDTSEPKKVAKKIFELVERDGNIWSRSGFFPSTLPSELFNEGFSNPAYRKIKKYFNRFGYSGFDGDLAASMTRDYHAAVNMVNHLVDLRNKIAHGDTAVTKTPADIKAMVSVVKSFCTQTDMVFAGWCTDNLCSIR